MATQICPKCREDSFTWSMDDEISDLTIWGCYKCFYQAFENESEERTCSTCGNKSESKLQEKESEYWWCWTCQKHTE
jgi:hypothetical protein